jgi:hypothetical protein
MPWLRQQKQKYEFKSTSSFSQKMESQLPNTIDNETHDPSSIGRLFAG